jgi:hypothetical protein
MPLLTQQKQRKFIEVGFFMISKAGGREHFDGIREFVVSYATTEGTVKEFKAFRDGFNQKLDELQVFLNAQKSSDWKKNIDEGLRPQMMEYAFETVTHALIDRAESACDNEGVEIGATEFKQYLATSSNGEKLTQEQVKAFQDGLDIKLKKTIQYYKDDEDSTTSIPERALSLLKNLIGIIVGFFTCLALCYKPYRDGVRDMFFSGPETKESRAFRACAAPLHHDVMEHLDAYVNTGP